jgi:predicted ATPase
MFPARLPPSLSRFVGREDDLAEITRLLAAPSLGVPGQNAAHPAVRLLTLTGPGGIGKSRLAIESATHLAALHQDGAHFVTLVEVAEPDQVAAVIARAIGINFTPGRSTGDDLCAALRDRQMLRLLDNFEQVISAASLVADPLAAAPAPDSFGNQSGTAANPW